MNNKGFTLVELLATIALLAIIAVISFVSINALIENSKVNNCENLVDNIVTAAKDFVSDNRYKVTVNGSVISMKGHTISKVSGVMTLNISVSDLIVDKYLSSSVIDPFSKNVMDSSKISVEIKLNSDYSADTVRVLTNTNEVNCDNKYTFEYAGGLSSGTSVPGGSGGAGGSAKVVKYEDRFPAGASCASAIDEFYSKNGVTYYFNCVRSPYIYVIVNGVEYNLVDALKSGVVTIEEVEAARGSKFPSKKTNVSAY